MFKMLTDGIFLYHCFEGMSQYHKNSVYFFYYDHRNTISFTEFFGNCSIKDLGMIIVNSARESITNFSSIFV